ncbi:Peptidase S41 family protein ustP [Colletotrichum trifolii]|uniref:Peptidase S41 family protein ustP n=1 Tax=Colletotrichum trifolii TaxID=5466 RepID=A0A4R8Q4I3_COLTR|nr:Peptidase S41 family protein ustP [Colletotrichum trifolii]
MLHLVSALVRVLLLASLAVAAPSVSSQLRRRDNGNACAAISEAYDRAGSDSTTGGLVVRPSLALDCLRSVRVDVERDVALVKYLRPWLEFQSTVGILPNPPEGYLYPGVDIFGGLDNITQALEDGNYRSQLDFAVDLYRLINVKPRDGHLKFTPIIGTLFIFETPALFVSVSEDGVATPKVYLYSDYAQSVEQGYNASEVVRLDSVPIVNHLQQRSVDNSRDQDPDAAYNGQLYSAALANLLETTRARRFVYTTTLADTSVIEFANSTRATVTNMARVATNFSSIDSSETLHERFEVPGKTSKAEVPSPRAQPGFVPALVGYPEPFVIHEDRYLSGYHLDEPALKDTAVLAVNLFLSLNHTGGEATLSSDVLADVADFSRVGAEFVEVSRKQGKSKLIIDLQGNGGGFFLNAMSLCASLFPEAGGKKANMKMRVRAHPLLNWVGSMLGKMGADVKSMPYPVGSNGFLDKDLNNFTDWNSFYGPERIGEDEYTNIMQPEEVSYAADALPGIFTIPESWFRPEDTVIVTDGHCASGCAHVVGMMTRELGIQVVAMGGRPIDAPMQAVGGTKGGPVVALDSYQKLWPALGPVEPPEGIDVAPFAEAEPPLAGVPTDFWTVNSANVYLDDDLSSTPVQFHYEAANCKLFYTWDTLTNMTNLWSVVADVKWNGARCVRGSTTNDDDTMGTSTPSYSEEVLSGFTWAAGPGDVAQRPRSSTGSNDGVGKGEKDKSAAGSLRASRGLESIAIIAPVLVSVMWIV